MSGFSTGLSALQAAQVAIRTIGTNLANRATPGYAREHVVLATAESVLSGRFHIGTGVQLGELRRIADETLESRVRSQAATVSHAGTRLDILTELQGLYGSPFGSTISEGMSGFFDSLSALAAAPSDTARRMDVVQSGVGLAESFRTLWNGFTDLSDAVATLARSDVDEVNRLADALAVINDRVARTSVGGVPDPALLDRRAAILEELSELVDIRVRDAGGGIVTVSVGGQMLVGSTGVNRLDLETDADGGRSLRLSGARGGLTLRGGRLAARMESLAEAAAPQRDSLDALAQALILDVNRLHSTGIPGAGGFRSLTSEFSVSDANGSGSLLDESLAAAGLPFEIRGGSLWITVSETATGDVVKSRIDVDPWETTVGDLLGALDAVPHVSASLDAEGRLRIGTEAGYLFDFSRRLAPRPDAAGTFGSAHPVLTGATAGPFALTDGSGFSLSVDGGPAQTVSFSAAAFADIGAATADEVAAAINSQVVNATAVVVDGRIAIRSLATGSSASLALTDGAGSPLAALGLPTGSVTGFAVGANPEISGTFTGDTTRTLTFRALGDGEIGVTPGLAVGVYDGSGALLATLDVGEGYDPGDSLEVIDGIEITFGPGRISATGGDRFDLVAVAEPDTADLLPAFGLNAFFTGSTARDIAVADRLVRDPSLFAGGRSGGNSDNGRILDLMALREAAHETLDDATFEEAQQATVARIANETARARDAISTQESVLEALRTRRDRISGVSTDEELLLLEEAQRNYQAAARFIDAVSTVSQILMNLGS